MSKCDLFTVAIDQRCARYKQATVYFAYVIAHLILIKTLYGKFYRPYFTTEETEVQGGDVTCLRSDR